MNELAFYFKEGWQHIISTDALDHQLFILALVAIYLLKDFKKIVILVTAFTIGHSITLFLSIYHIITINSNWVEFLIPCTIVITSFSNFFYQNEKFKKVNYPYLFALLFGFIHGLGYANTIRFMLAKGQGLGMALLGFNIGLEAGQLIVVSIILATSYAIVNVFKIPQRYWVYTIATLTFIWAVKMALERVP